MIGTGVTTLAEASRLTVVLAKGYGALRLHDRNDVIIGISVMKLEHVRHLIRELENLAVRLERGDAPRQPELVQ